MFVKQKSSLYSVASKLLLSSVLKRAFHQIFFECFKMFLPVSVGGGKYLKNLQRVTVLVSKVPQAESKAYFSYPLEKFLKFGQQFVTQSSIS